MQGHVSVFNSNVTWSSDIRLTQYTCNGVIVSTQEQITLNPKNRARVQMINSDISHFYSLSESSATSSAYSSTSALPFCLFLEWVDTFKAAETSVVHGA